MITKLILKRVSMLKKTILILAMILFVSTFSAASSFRCNGRIVSDGDVKYDVLIRCQQPYLSDTTEKEVIRRVSPSEWRKYQVKRETWLYNYGPSSLMRLMVFENEKLMEIRSLGYGYMDGDIGRYAGDISKLTRGITSVEVLIHWGRPSYRSDRNEERIIKIDDSNYMKTYVTVSDWIYNLGQNRLTRTLVFEAGELVEVKDGNYGM